MAPHVVAESTREAVMARRTPRGLVALARELGYADGFAGVLSSVIHGVPGKMTLDSENLLRRRLGLSCIGVARVTVCPSCGGVHRVEDCGGVQVRVVALQKGEHISRRNRPPRRWLDMPPEEVAEAMRNREVMR